ncbi:MAG: helix-turn-helix domain-containing protein [Solirubrobacteraceae bacterium]
MERVAQRVASLAAGSPSDPWLSIEEAAEHLRARPQRLYDLVSAGRLRPAKDGRRLLFRRSWIDSYLEGGNRQDGGPGARSPAPVHKQKPPPTTRSCPRTQKGGPSGP